MDEGQVTYTVLVGIDWASEEHEVCLLKRGQEQVERWKVLHSGVELEQLANRLVERANGAREAVAVGIETPHGPVVETLMARGIHVYAINPKQVDRFRDRHSMAGAKSDSLDAYVIADALRNDLHLFRRLQGEEPELVELREASRLQGELTEQRLQQANRLRELLYRYYPALLKLSPAADEPWLWTLLLRAATPAAGKRLKEPTLRRLLLAHRIRRITGEELQAVLKEQPVKVAPGVEAACSMHVQVLIPQLRLLDQQHAVNNERIRKLLGKLSEPSASPNGEVRKHRDAEILLSLPGVGDQIGATMLAEASQALALRDYATLRAMCGVAPVRRMTGQNKGRPKGRGVVVMRRACSERLRQAAFHLGAKAGQYESKSKALFTEHRAKGHSLGRSARAVADRYLKVLIALLRNDQLYDPARRQTASPKAA